MPNNIVTMVTSEAELRYCYLMLVLVPFLSAFIGIGLARGDNEWWTWAVRLLALAAYSFMLVTIAKSRFTLWQIKGDLMR